MVNTINSPNFDKIGYMIINKLGKPPNYYETRIIKLFGEYHRANVYSRVGMTSTMIDSFFFKYTEAGGIMEPRPEIVRKY